MQNKVIQNIDELQIIFFLSQKSTDIISVYCTNFNLI